MSDADRVSVGYKVESTYGTQQTGTNYQELRLRSETLAQNTTSVRSQEIRNDRQIVGVKRSDVRVAGALEGEFSYGTYDEFLAAVLFAANSWTPTAVGVSGTVYSMANSDSSLNRSSGNFSTDGFTAGQIIKISGFATAANNGFFRAISVATTKIVVDAVVTTEAAGPTVAIKGFSSIVNGTTLNSFSFQRKYNDLSNEVANFKGCAFEGTTLRIDTAALNTIGFEIVGKVEVSGTTAETLTPANSNDITNAIDDISLMQEGATAFAAEVLAFTVAIKNNIRARLAVGNLGPVSLGSGKCEVTGTLRLYFSTKTLYDKYLNFTSTSLRFVVKDSANNYYCIDLPAVRLTTGARVPQGENTDIIADFTFQAFRDGTQGITIKVARLPNTV